MYFIQPTRDIPYLDQVIDTLPSVQMIRIDDIDLYDQTIIAIADVQDYLTHRWNLPTIVLGFEDEGLALSQAWEQGALAGWIWSKLPTEPQQIESSHRSEGIDLSELQKEQVTFDAID